MSYRSRGYLFIMPARVLARAVISATPGSYPVAELAVSWTANGHNAVPEGCTVLFGSAAGADDMGRQRVRKPPTAGTVYIGKSAAGGRPGELIAEAGIHLTFLDLREPWVKLPTADPDTEELFKDHDIAPGTYPARRAPVANAGTAICDWAKSGVLDVDFDASDSISLSGGSLSHSWDFKDGLVLSGGADQAAARVRFPEGWRWVRYTTSDGYHTSFADRLVVALGDACRPVAVELKGRTVKPNGQTLSFRTLEDLPASVYPYGTLCVFATRQGSARAPAQVRFVGWLTQSSESVAGTEKGVRRNTTVEAADLAARLSEMQGFSQTVRHAGGASSWREMASPDLRDYLLYLLYWHSNACAITDVHVPDLSAYPFQALESGEQNIFAQVSDLARAVSHVLTCDQAGALHIVPDPLLQPYNERPSKVALALTPSDYTSLEFDRRDNPAVYWLDASGVPAQHSAPEQSYFAIAPAIAAPGRGDRRQTLRMQLLEKPYQHTLNKRAAALYARLNNPYTKMQLTLARPGDAPEPALMQWVKVTLDAAYAARRGISFANTRALVSEMQISYRDNGVERVALTLETETLEAAASQTVPVAESGQAVDVEFGGANIPAFYNSGWVGIPGLTFPNLSLDDLFVMPPVEPGATAWLPPVAWPGKKEEDESHWPARIAAVSKNNASPNTTRVAVCNIDVGETPDWSLASAGLSGGHSYTDPVSSKEITHTFDSACFTYSPLNGHAYCSTSDGFFVCENLWGANPLWVKTNDFGPTNLIASYIKEGWVVGNSETRFYWSKDGGQNWHYWDLEAIFSLGIKIRNIELVQGAVSGGLIAHVNSTHSGPNVPNGLVKLTDDFETLSEYQVIPGFFGGRAHFEIPPKIGPKWNVDGKHIRLQVPYVYPWPDHRRLVSSDGGETWPAEEDHYWIDPDTGLEGGKVVLRGRNQMTSYQLRDDHLQFEIPTGIAAGNPDKPVRSIDHSLEYEVPPGKCPKISGYSAGFTYGLVPFFKNGLWHCVWGVNQLWITPDALETDFIDYMHNGNLLTVVKNFIVGVIVDNWSEPAT